MEVTGLTQRMHMKDNREVEELKSKCEQYKAIINELQSKNKENEEKF